MSEAAPLHPDCVVCLCLINKSDGEEASLVLLKLLQEIPADQILGDLCLSHARRLGPIGVRATTPT